MPFPRSRRSSVQKGENAQIPVPPPAECLDGDDRGDESSKADGDMSDDGKKPWETDASKGDEDEDEDEKPVGAASKGDDDEDDDDDEKDGKDATSKSFRGQLQKAINFLARHGELHDPAVRKEALMAKELKGGGLNKSERVELVGLLSGGVQRGGLADQTASAQAPGPALRKSMVDNRAMGEAYDNVTKSLHAQARYIDEVSKATESTNYAMARALVKACEGVAAVYDRQEALAEAISDLARQPTAAPRSVGLRWSEKSFAGDGGAPMGVKGGRLEKAGPQKIRQALKELAKSHGARSSSGQAFQMAAEGMLMNKPLMPSVAAAVEQHLSEAS